MKKRRNKLRKKRPASIGRRRRITSIDKVTDKPLYKEGRVYWKGIDVSVKEAREFAQQISRTPVSRGQFPTEADIILNTVFGPTIDDGTFNIEDADPQAVKSLEQWRDNYLKALNNVSAITKSSKAQDIYDEIYWKVASMSLGTFAKTMYENYGELSVTFEYDDARYYKWSKRFKSIWDKYE